MARIVPNGESWIGFLADAVPADLCAPTIAEIDACVDLTCMVSSLNAGAQGNTVPTPSLCSLFETSISGTSQATFQGEFYRDDERVGGVATGDLIDHARNTLPRKARGTFIIVRFACPVDVATGYPKPEVDTVCECWPVEVTSRGAGPMASGTPQSFTSTSSVNVEPCESAVVVA